jgi:hypothetical protein
VPHHSRSYRRQRRSTRKKSRKKTGNFTCQHRLGMSQPVNAHVSSRGPAALVKVIGAASKRELSA